MKNSSSTTIGEYSCDGDGKRVKKHVPATGETTVFVYDASNKLVAEYSTIVEPTATHMTWIRYISLIVGLLLLMPTAGCLPVLNLPANPTPRTYEGKELSAAIDAALNRHGLFFSGMAFYRNALYVTSNLGLLKFSEDGGKYLFAWNPNADMVSGPWVDTPNQQLWIFHDNLYKFISFDGTRWSAFDEPKVLTRGEFLSGYRGVSNDENFWIQSWSDAWRWDEEKHTFDQVVFPDVPCDNGLSQQVPASSCFGFLAPTKEYELLLMHSQVIDSFFEISMTLPHFESPPQDRVLVRVNGSWVEKASTDSRDFVTKKLVTTSNAAYALTYYKSIYRIDENQIEVLETPGEIEAMTGGRNGALIVSIKDLGIFQYTDRWSKLYDCPYPKDFPERFAYIAADDSRVAFSVSPRQTKVEKGAYRSHLWISNSSNLVEITPSGSK